MKKLIKSFISYVVLKILNIELLSFMREKILNNFFEKKLNVNYNNQNLIFSIPNGLNKFRAETFSTKEPETLNWIESFKANSTLWDIGANVGLYSIYAASLKNCEVYSFEPSVFNLELLSRNINLNNLSDKINIIPIALNDKIGFNYFKLSSIQLGGALSTFAKDYDQDGKPINDIFSYQTFGCSIDDAVLKLNIPSPDYIKIDVDGIEHLILEGGVNTLKSVNSILVEINDNFKEQLNLSKKYLTKAGLHMIHKLHSDIYDDPDSEYKSTFNQIWKR